MKFYLINGVILLIFVVQNVFTLPTFDDSEDQLIKFDTRMKRDVDSSSSSASSEESGKKETSYEKQKKEIQSLEDKIKAARKKLAEKKKGSATSKTNSDVFVFAPPGFTTTEQPTRQSLYEKQREAMEKLSEGLKAAMKQYEENVKKEANSTGILGSESNVQKRSIENLYDFRNELQERMTEIRAKRAAHRQRRAQAEDLSRSASKSDQDLLQLLNDIETMTEQVRSVRSKFQDDN